MASNIHGLKIIIVAPIPPPYGGMALQAEKMYRYLRDEGAEAKIIKTNQDISKRLSLIYKVRGLRGLVKSILFISQLLKDIRKAEVVYVLSASYLYFFLHTAPSVLLAKMFNKKVFVNHRGGASEPFLKKWGFAARPFFTLADGIIVPSGFLQEVLKRFGIQVKVIPNIVDIELFKFNSRKTIRPYLLVTRHLESIYNVECVIRAFQIVKNRLRDTRLGIAGEGSQSEYLKRLVKELNLEDVIFYGTIPHSELPRLYGEYDIYVNASNFDNFPGGIMEAFASGVAVVTTKAGGIPYIVEHKKTGLLVELNDYKNMAVRIIELIENPDFAIQIAKNARAECLNYEWKKVKQNFVETCFAR